MRVSVIKGDMGYREDARRSEAFIDDKFIKYCITADEELGMATYYKTDLAGNFIIGKTGPVIYTSRGNVVIKKATK